MVGSAGDFTLLLEAGGDGINFNKSGSKLTSAKTCRPRKR